MNSVRLVLNEEGINSKVLKTSEAIGIVDYHPEDREILFLVENSPGIRGVHGVKIPYSSVKSIHAIKADRTVNMAVDLFAQHISMIKYDKK